MTYRDPKKQLRARRRYRAKHVAAGLCTRCPQPATRGTMCERHAEQNAAYKRDADAARKSKGLCICCPSPAVEQDRCAKHLEERRLYFQAYLDERRARNQCASCGRPTGGFRLCPPDRERYNARRRKRRDAAPERLAG